MNIFEVAVRGKFRFPSKRGELTIENLLDLPLQSKTGLDLDSIAKEINVDLKQTGEESFVETVSPRNTELAQKLEAVKTVIKIKQDENSAVIQKAARRLEIAKLEELLGRKKDAALESLPAEEIEAKLKQLKG